jgi:hypothetical protein
MKPRLIGLALAAADGGALAIRAIALTRAACPDGAPIDRAA